MFKETEVTTTDLALGDDALAVLAKVSLASMSMSEQIYVSAYGNRSARIAYQNLKSFVPQSEDLLRTRPGNDTTVLMGADRPSDNMEPYELEEGRVEYMIHGDMGNDDSPTTPDNSNLSLTYFEKPPEQEKSISILSLAATTEVKSVLEKSIKQGVGVSSVVLMGGTIDIQGNTDPRQEANFRHDPKSNIAVFEIASKNKIPLVLVPLDLTENEQVLFSPDRVKWMTEELRSNSPKVLELVKKVVTPESTYGGFYLGRTHHEQNYPWKEVSYTGVPVHDLTATLVEHDIKNNLGIFSYTNKNIKLNERGEIGIARDYMLPSFPAIIAGAVQNYDLLWETIATSLKQYK